MSDSNRPRQLPPREPIALVITRAEIEQGTVSTVLRKLLSLLESPERAVSYRSRVQLAVVGFDDDPREPYLIDQGNRIKMRMTLS